MKNYIKCCFLNNKLNKLIFFILFFSFFLNGCVFQLFKEKNNIPYLKLEHVSTQVNFNDSYSMKTILSSDISFNEENLKKLTGLTATYQMFKCVDQKKKISDKSKNSYNFLIGKINKTFVINNKFYYEITYSSNSGSLEYYFKKYNPNILYCQYNIYFWNSTESKSDLFEIKISDKSFL